MGNEAPDSLDVVEFGSFRLFPAKRLLEKDGVAVQIGGRALDILILLAERAGEVVSKRELVSQAWPNVTVDESSLRVHISGLRKAIGDGDGGTRYITNVAGRGYCFVGAVSRTTAPTAPTAEDLAVPGTAHGLPPRMSRIFGRDEVVLSIGQRLTERRFVTIHGPGGVGKTTVAVSVATGQIPVFDGQVYFCDLSHLSDPRHVPSTLATLLGIAVQSSDPTPSIVSFLRKRRMLIVFDSCEHVIDAAAALADRIFQTAPEVSVLATSQEPLRVEGEYVHTLAPLESPPSSERLTAEQILGFPAARLFFDRAMAGGYQFVLTETDAPIVAEICRKLDGIALAIELAAGRVGAYGLRETAELLDSRLRLLWHGRRTAVPRHQTLSATLDWSYSLLTDVQRTVLKRLSIFVGVFTIDSAQAVAAESDIDPPLVADAVGELVVKSLVSVSTGDKTGYRLLNTTRAYAMTKLIESGEADRVARRHAEHYRDLLARSDSTGAGSRDGRPLNSKHLENVRLALEWSFSEPGNAPLGTALAALSARVFMQMSLFDECHRWADRALNAMDDAARGTHLELELQTALGVSLMFTKGNTDYAHAALVRGMALAEQLEDRVKQLYLLGQLHVFYRRAGDFHRMLQTAQQSETAAKHLSDATANAFACSLLGAAYHLCGDQAAARTNLESALAWSTAPGPDRRDQYSFHPHRTRIALARALWLLGCPDRAVLTARETAAEASADADPMTLCIVLIWCASVYQWIGDFETANDYLDRLIAHADQHSLTQYRTVGFGMKGRGLIDNGDIEPGTTLLRGALDSLRLDRFELYSTGLNCALAEGLALSGSVDQALTLLEQTEVQADRNGDMLYMPELLRLRGELLARTVDEARAEESLTTSIELAEKQSALSWQLRSAISLTKLRLKRRCTTEAAEPLSGIYARFTEGFDTADLRTARSLLDQLA